MLIVKRVSNRPREKGDYLVRLTDWLDPADPEVGENGFGYYCDKAHLRHMLLELLPHFKGELGVSLYMLIQERVRGR